MTCKTAETLLHRSLDGPLTQPERLALDTHWESCASCRRERDAQRNLAQTAHRWAGRFLGASDPGEHFTAQVLSRLEAPPRRSPLRLGLPLAVTMLLVAALALLPGLPDEIPPRSLTLSLYGLPHWLVVNSAALPGDALALRHLPQAAFGLPWTPILLIWTPVLLPVMIGLNAVFCFHARQSGLRRSVS